MASKHVGLGCTMVAALIALGVAHGAQGGMVAFDAGFVFSGDTPTETAPWWSVSFDDEDTPGSVIMTIIAANLSSTEFISEVYLNLDPGLSPDLLVFTPGAGMGIFSSPIVSTGIDAFKADGDGYFDILVSFAVAPPATRFTDEDKAVFTITGLSSLTASSFDVLSTPNGAGAGLYPVGAHIQGIGGTASGWTSVPEPMTLLLLAVGGLLGLRGRR